MTNLLQWEEMKAELQNAEVDKKVCIVLKLIQNKKKIPNFTKKELVRSVEDLHVQCRLLYSLFDDSGTGGKVVEVGTAFSSRSSSDSDYYSSEEVEMNGGNIRERLSSDNAVIIRKLQDTELRNEDLKRQLSVLKQKTDSMELAGDIEGKRNEDREQQHFKGLMTKIDLLKEENQKLQTRIAEIEYKSKKLESQVSYQEDIIQRQSVENKERQDAIDKLLEDQKLKKRWSCGSKLNTNILEKKMEELAGDFRMKMEDHIRILYRRIHVAEELHVESKRNFYIKTQTKEKKVSQIELEKMVEQVLAGPEMALKKLEESEELVSRVRRLAKEIDSARKWVKEREKKMKHEVETLEAKLECREAQESLLKEKLSKLEAKLGEEGTGKQSLEKAKRRIKKLEIDVKEKEFELLNLGEGKREAIRQLCVLVDYQRCRYDDLKTSIFNVALHA